MNEKPSISGSDKASIVGRYSERFAKHGATIESLNVGNIQKYARQHEIHYDLIPPMANSITDVGCGVALFHTFLKSKGRRMAYTGIDIVPAFTESNLVSHPEADFETRDIFAEGLNGVTDHVVMCQVFNNRFQDSDNFEVVKRALAITFAAATLSVSIDMLSTYVNYEERHLYYFDPQAVFAFAKTLTPFVTLRHDYSPHHFTVALYKTCTSGSA